MAHQEQFEFVRRCRQIFPEAFTATRVLEVGSWDINGSVRPLFENSEYIGVDVAEGASVDKVCPGQLVDDASESFDVVISCECFEHNPFWLETFINMTRMLKPGGLCIMSCASTGRTEHGTRRMAATASLSTDADWFADYYANLDERAFTRRLRLENHFAAHCFRENIYTKDLYFCGVKAGPDQDSAAARERIQRLSDDLKSLRKIGMSPWKIPLAWTKWCYRKGIISVIGEAGHREVAFRWKQVFRGVRGRSTTDPSPQPAAAAGESTKSAGRRAA